MKWNFLKVLAPVSLLLLSVNAIADDKITGYRGKVFYFIDSPVEVTDVKDSYKYYEDGVLYVQDGKILEAGEYASLKSKYGNKVTLVDYTGRLITPGFVDAHVHYAQTEMVASFGDQLVQWLEKYTMPTERKCGDLKYATKIANIFLDQLVTNGTTTAQVFCTVAPASVEAFFTEAQKRNMRMIAGLAFMDENAPEYALITPEKAYTETTRLIKKWNNNGRLNYSVTPRSAYLLSDAEMQVATRLLKENPGIRL